MTKNGLIQKKREDNERGKKGRDEDEKNKGEEAKRRGGHGVTTEILLYPKNGSFWWKGDHTSWLYKKRDEDEGQSERSLDVSKSPKTIEKCKE